MKSPHGLPMIRSGCNQGRLSEGSHRATLACYFGLLYWLTAPVRWARSLNVGEWLAVTLAALAIAQTVWRLL